MPVLTARRPRRLAAAASLLAAAALSAGAAPALAAPPAPAGRALPADTTFAQRTPDHAARKQVARLRKAGETADAAALRRMLKTPQANWLDRGTPKQVRQQVKRIVHKAAGKGTVPVLVVYYVPGRDCSQYSSGGASSDAAYRRWIDAAVSGLGQHRALVLVEPDGLANLPSDCPGAYPGQDVAALTTSRIADIRYAGHQIERSDRRARVYLDAGHSGWHSVGDMAQRLDQAGVADLQGFFLNVSNYQYSANSDFFGTWVADCLAYASDDNDRHQAVAAADWGGCGNQYWNGGPANNYSGVAMNNYGVWSPDATDPALNTAGITSRYAQQLGDVQPRAHFVVDTSRNANGPDDMSRYAEAPYNQPADVITALRNGNWCNAPTAGLGHRPQAHPEADFPLLDAYLWVKTPGQSDGQCNIAGGARAWDYSAYNPWHWDATQQAQNDPLWGQKDPAAGAWFPAEALALIHNSR